MPGQPHDVTEPTTLAFRVQPRASRSEIVGWHGDSIKIRLKAPPADGAANDELVRFLAKRVGVPRSAVRILSGQTSRSKRVSLAGIGKRAALRAMGLEPS
ncbi:MAG: YggU family protein [Gemmatimonadota bacterium]|nr:MAG: YggU family protein [Gemmatimonadota bacterium]